MRSESSPPGPEPAPAFTIVGPRSWGLCTAQRLTPTMLGLLLADQVAAIVVHNVVGPSERQRIAAGLERHGLSWMPRTGLGPRQRDFAADPTEYFARAAHAHAVRRALAGPAGDPLGRLFAELDRAWAHGTRLANDPDHGTYFAGAFEHITGTPLDVDYAGRHSSSWHVGRYAEELRASICIHSGGGAETFLYRRSWTPNDEADITAGVEPWALVTGIAFVSVIAVKGALLLTNAKHFFRVDADLGQPATQFTCSLGITDNHSPMEAWS